MSTQEDQNVASSDSTRAIQGSAERKFILRYVNQAAIGRCRDFSRRVCGAGADDDGFPFGNVHRLSPQGSKDVWQRLPLIEGSNYHAGLHFRPIRPRSNRRSKANLGRNNLIFSAQTPLTRVNVSRANFRSLAVKL